MRSKWARLSVFLSLRPAVLVWTAATILSVSVLGLSAMFLLGLREDELRNAERDLKRYTLTIAEQADRSIKSLDLVQSSVIDHILRTREAGGDQALDMFGTLEINALLKGKLSGLPHIDAITLQSADGRIINFSRDWPVPVLNVSFRDYFQGLKNDKNRTTYVSSPAPSAITGAWALYIARRLTGPNGEFLGVVNGTIKLQYFEDLYTSTSLGDGSATSLMRDDGMRLARFPREGIGQVFASEPLIMGTNRTGLVREIDPADKRMTIKAAHGLSTTPMYILASQTEDSILRSWRNTATLFTSLSVGLCSLLFLAAALILRWWRQHEDAARIGEEKALAEKARAEAEAVLAREREEAAEKSNQIKSQFLATMSHEIRTPMNGVLGMADLLSRTEMTGQQQRMLTTINQSATTLLTIINDILDFSRVEAGRMELEQRSFDLRDCAEQVLEMFAKDAEKKGVELSLCYPAAVPSRVLGDQGRLRQVLTNLVGNAMKFTSQGEVAVRVSALGECDGKCGFQFSVTDTGVGIDDNTKAMLFKPFIQADSSISRRFGGTGLGLSIAKHLVTLMDGHVELKSALGVGTTITFDVQLTADTEVHPELFKDAPIKVGQRVLIVAKAGASRDALKTYISELSADPLCVATVEQAMDCLRAGIKEQNPFAVAVIDRDSIALAHQTRADAALADLRLIKVTTLTRETDAATARAAGISACLRKPVRRSDLLVAIEACFAKPSLRNADLVGPTVVAKPVETALSGLTLLVAEDNPVNQEVAIEFLRELGCKAQIADNGRLAVEAFTTGSFDAVLMDCQMPEMDGLSACREIRALEAGLGLTRIPIIAVTANAYARDRDMCLAAGMDDFVSKPFSAEHLANVLTRTLLRRQLDALASPRQTTEIKVAS
jgi:signal transduction histidine kinase/CheY-like chemotaxis protein